MLAAEEGGVIARVKFKDGQYISFSGVASCPQYGSGAFLEVKRGGTLIALINPAEVAYVTLHAEPTDAQS